MPRLAKDNGEVGGDGVTIPRLEWWDHAIVHPMSDAEFIEAFCGWVFVHTDDKSLALVRRRVNHFIRNFMAPEIAVSLAKYRERHPL